MMLAFKPDWVPLAAGPEDALFDHYPDLSLADWHRAQGLWVD